MNDEKSNFNLPEEPMKEGFPWLGMLVVLVVIGAAAIWIVHEKTQRKELDTAIASREMEVNSANAALEQERDRVIELSHRLDAMKQAILSGQFKGKEKKKAVDDYNKLAAEQRTEREKVKALADEYNAKVSQLHQLQ